ncbi:Hydroxyacylglutathione hydrolase [Sinobacterium norvegicum]|uniref:Hydroxyacylglutathione hydrolase n=1 Tax=Sinobacterium norvegicum TaxID=1641715 RepID=A0ABM9ACB5_9GAMM|nr:hydroxyacylglutathione hydrolase [Sinobacterium norvegicum]CAH0990278.1 Hydroxyacylglutathione hydrolase [Sinobacterium norvegicum]
MQSIDRIEAFNDNYIWLLSNAGLAAVVDPGDAQPVIERLQDLNLKLTTILITHHHLDHVGGIEELRKAYPDVTVYAPHNSPYKQADISVGQGDDVDVLGDIYQVIGVPGHTLDHIAYFNLGSDNRPTLFCGDTLFAGGCGRVFEGTYAQMHQSLSLLAELPGETAVYCAHEYTQANLLFAQAVEPNNTVLAERVIKVDNDRANNIATVPTFIRTELATNPFLRCNQVSVIDAATALSTNEINPSDVEQVFAAIRQWKDAF